MIQNKFLFPKSRYDLKDCENSFILVEKLPPDEDVTEHRLHVGKG